MANRSRMAFVLAMLMATSFAVSVSASVSAKGGFAFITITGANLKGTVRAAEGELTQDFFAFADFYNNKSVAPADPGLGYEITRYYIENSREVAFDKLHYYPEAGFVFYDGITNGSSEYDGKWYTANVEMKTAFERVLPKAALPASSPHQPGEQTNSNQPTSVSQFRMPVVVMAGLAAVALMFILARHQRAVR